MYINKVRSRTATSCKLSDLPEIFKDLCFSNDLEKRSWFSDSAGQNILECTKKLTRHFCKKILVFLCQASVLSKKTFFFTNFISKRNFYLRQEDFSLPREDLSSCRNETNPLAVRGKSSKILLPQKDSFLLPQEDFLLATRGISSCRKRILSRGIPLAAKF